MRHLPHPNATILEGRCPICGHRLVIRSANSRPQCASWLCELRAFLAAAGMPPVGAER